MKSQLSLLERTAAALRGRKSEKRWFAECEGERIEVSQLIGECQKALDKTLPVELQTLQMNGSFDAIEAVREKIRKTEERLEDLENRHRALDREGRAARQREDRQALDEAVRRLPSLVNAYEDMMAKHRNAENQLRDEIRALAQPVDRFYRLIVDHRGSVLAPEILKGVPDPRTWPWLQTLARQIGELPRWILPAELRRTAQQEPRFEIVDGKVQFYGVWTRVEVSALPWETFPPGTQRPHIADEDGASPRQPPLGAPPAAFSHGTP